METQEPEPSRVPWQFEWKRPQWQEVEQNHEGEASSSAVEGTCLCMVSALVAAEEVPGYNAGENENANFLLNVTVVSSPFCVDTPGAGDLLVLEIVHQPSGATARDEDEAGGGGGEDTEKPKKLLMKVLRWPGVALQQDPKSEADAGPNKSWRHNLPVWLGGIPKNQLSQGKNTVGVVSVCLCRRKNGENEQQKALDALDTMTFLSLGMGPEVQTSNVTTTPKNDNDSTRSSEEDQPAPELILTCLCSDGHVHLYSPWSLLQLSETKKQVEDRGDAFANSMSSFLLGDYVFEQLQSSIWPLSQPEETLQLTVPMPRPGKKSTKEGSNIAGDTAFENSEEDSVGLSLWDRSVWDPQVDPFTAIYRTVDNTPTHCISAFEYIVIAGRGRRVRMVKASTAQGGFLTVLSLQHFSEVRTLFLPFAPRNISPFVWGGMQFLFVVGNQGVAVAIRIDISVYNSVILGQAPSLATAMQDPNDPIIPTVSSDHSLLSYQSSNSQTHNPERKKPNKMARCFVHRFQILPIQLPETISDETEALSIAMATIFGSSPLCSPPSMVMVSNNSQKQVLVVKSKLESVNFARHTNSPSHRLFRGYRRSRSRKILAITTSQEPRHVARIRPSPTDSDIDTDAKEEIADKTWCHLGQGWCLLGIADRVHIICWEGATSSRGAYVHELRRLGIVSNESTQEYGLHCDILPVNPFMSEAVHRGYQNIGQDLALPFTQEDAVAEDSKLRRVMSVEGKKSAKNAGSKEEGSGSEMDDVVAEAIRSISMADYKKNVIGSSPRSSLKRNIDHYSHREKSIRLLRKCPTWSELDDTQQNRMGVEGQVSMLNARLRSHNGNPHLLTLRCLSADIGADTAFNQILSWLSQKGDYFTAASVALDLKKDVSTLRHLWRSFDRIDEDDERTKLEGLLDGIIPIHEQMVSDESEGDQTLQTAMVQLADMTVGCLCRGGFAMAPTLEFFLQRDPYYESNRTCLVLAAIAAQAVADDEGKPLAYMGSSYKRPTDPDQFVQDILWPVRCLLQVGVARKVLSTALALINAALPGELRRKQQHKKLDSMMLCLALIKLIIGSSPDATVLLLDLVDEQERKRFWSSIDHETQMELALVTIDDKCPLLQQPEVRSWALHHLERSFHDPASDNGWGSQEASIIWLKRLCSGCLLNSACDISGLLSMRGGLEATIDSGDGLVEHMREVAHTRDALIAGSGSGGLDFNLFIPTLLLLQIHNQQWSTESVVSTQSMLNAACNLAGHVTFEEPLFAFDGTSLMKQCALAENICAGANLIGGKNGLVLECCWILIECSSMSMEEAELFLRSDDSMSRPQDFDSSESEKISDDFVIGFGHQHVLWLLDQHTLQVKTYGEFDSTPARGKVDPVFAARICLRAWYYLTKSQLPSASSWLASWLRRQLGVGDDCVSTKRLACAALTQVLLWPASREKASILAEQLKLEPRFLVQISQACWSLVEAVPPALADELLAQGGIGSPPQKRLPGGKAPYIS